MSIFDSLPTGMLASKPPPGYRGRRRKTEPSAARDELDAKVAAAGGWFESEAIPSKGLRPVRYFARTHMASWYVIPESAFEEA